MVYCGKPSRGCQMCRTRRIKCDETKPTCLQCQKSRRQCPGYKDDFDLVFRNETQATERRAKRATTASKKASTQLAHARQRQQETTLQFPDYQYGRAMSPSDMSVVSTASEASPSTALFSPASIKSDYSNLPMISASIPGQIDTSFEAQAIHFFLSNWVLLPHQGTSRGYLDFLLPLLRTSPPDSHLSLTFSAVGLAALGNRTSPGMNSKGLLPYAAAKYEKALKRTNEALRDPVLAKQDSTLASVLLLGLFEQITSCRSNLMGWGSHVDGAVALIRMRGKKQLRTAVGKGLFIAVRTQMVVNCTSSSKPPHLGTEFWTTDAMKDHYGQEITRLNLLVAELRAEVNKTMTMATRTAANMEKVLGHMRQAQELEDRFKKWRTTLPPEWLPRCAMWEGDGEMEGTEAEWSLYPGEIHSYQDIWQASVWNMSHVSRLFLSGILVRCAAWICSPLDYRETPEYATAVAVATDMLAKIIAVIPFLLGWGLQDFGGSKRMGTVENGEFAVGGGGFGAQKSVPRALGGFFALWPLFTAACSDYVDESQRRWAIGRLRWITEEMGVNQAGVLSQFQLRLPSMVIKRDGMGISMPNARDMAKHSGPTANLPPAARPTKIEKSNHGHVGVKIKYDENSPRNSRANSIVEGSPMMSSNAPTSGSSTLRTTNQQEQQQNHYPGMVPQEGIPHTQRRDVLHRHTDEPSPQYTSQGYSSPERQVQMEAQNSGVYPNHSNSYSQSQAHQVQYQNRYSSPGSHHSISNAPSPPTYLTNTAIETNPNTAHSSLTKSNLSHYQRLEPEPPRTRMEAHRNHLDAAGRIERFISMTSEHEGSPSPPHPSSQVYHSPSPPMYHASPQQQFGGHMMNRPPSPIHQQDVFENSSMPSYNNFNFNTTNMDHKMSPYSESIPTPTSLYNNGSPVLHHNSTAYNHHPDLSNQQSIASNNPSVANQWTSNDHPQQPLLHRQNTNPHLEDRYHSNTNDMNASIATANSNANRLNWEIEMVGQEATRGNELERRHFQAHLRELTRQSTM